MHDMKTKIFFMKKFQITPLLSLLLLISCSNDKSLSFDNHTLLETIVIVDDLHVRVPGDFVLTDNYFVVIDPFGSDYALKVFSIENGEFLFDAAIKGKGPNELVSPATVHYDNNLIVFDIAAQKAVFYDKNNSIQNLIPKKEIFLDSDFFIDKMLLNDNLNALVLSKDKPCLVSNVDLNSSENLCVLANPFSKYDNSEINKLLNGTIKLESEGNYFAFATYDTPFFSIHKKEKGSFTELASGFIKEPKYISTKDNFRWITELTPNGFMDIAILPGRLFLLHAEISLEEAKDRSVEAIPDVIYELDFDGRLVTHYTLDSKVLRLASGKNGKLYGIALDQQDDKFKIVELPL